MHQASYLPGRLRPRLAVLALIAFLVVTACNDQADPLATSVPSDATEVANDETAVPVDGVTEGAVTYAGRLYGPTNLWSSYTNVKWGPAPFSGSLNFTGAGGLVTQINRARQMRQRLVLAMTGGPASNYMTNGKFDMAKWKKVMNSFNTSTIRNAVAAAVSDGTVVGNQLIDEPETAKWRGSVTKAMIDQMAAYAKNMFPTLPVGIVVGPPGYRWRASERFRRLDFVIYGYKWWITQGNVGTWRNAVLQQAKLDGVTPAFSVNILDGGVPDKKGSWDCAGTGGKGTYYPNCRMTATQLRSWGRSLVSSGCLLVMWRYDGAYMSKTANKDAFRDLASASASLSRRSCKRA